VNGYKEMDSVKKALLQQLAREAAQGGQDSFDSLSASELYCPKCKAAMPVREKQLLHLPGGGEVTDYLCERCGASLGSKRS